MHVSIRPAIPASLCGEGRIGVYDTLYVERWHTRWRDRLVTRTDTLWREQVHTETVRVRYVPAFYKYCVAALALLVLCLLLRLAYRLYRRLSIS